MSTANVIRYHTAGTHAQCMHGLEVKQTRKYLFVILMDPPIRLKKISIQEKRYITSLDYPTVKQARRHLRQAAKSWDNKLRKKVKRYL